MGDSFFFLTVLPSVFYFRVMAFSGQISWQQKQAIHVSVSTWGMLSSFMDRADAGHWSIQVPHPVHNPGSA
jgi:hypothetical protein